MKPTLHDDRTARLTATIGVGKKRGLPYVLTIHQGHNRNQKNVTLADEG